MALRFECPSCEAVLSISDDLRGKKVRCSRCKTVVDIPDGSTSSKARGTKPARGDDSEIDKSRPAGGIAKGNPPPVSRSVREERPDNRPRRRPRDDDYGDDVEDEREDRRRARGRERGEPSASSALPWVLGAAGGGVLLIGAAVGVFFLLAGSKPANAPPPVAQAAPIPPPVAPPAQPPVAQPPVAQPPAQPGVQPPVAQPPVAQPPVTPPPVAPPPAIQPPAARAPVVQLPIIGPAAKPPVAKPAVALPPAKQVDVPKGPVPAAIVPDITRKVKNATTYMKVTMANGEVGQGSGFFGAEPGLVFTNAHVLGMLRSLSDPPAKIEVVVHSGEADEFSLPAQLLGVDRDNDLAVVLVKAEPGRLPAPLPIDTAQTLTELQKVYVFGFPFGDILGKDITVSESSVSSLRKGADGSVKEVQVNGGISPGNSGGPVVDSRGVVIGVSVSIIRGTQINFAVPGEKVQGLLRGRVDKLDFGDSFQESARVKVPVQLRCLDPLVRIRDLKLDTWVGNSGRFRPLSLKAPEPLPGDGPKQTIALTYQNGEAVADVLVPPLSDGKVLWVQPVLTDGIGVTHWAAAIPFKSDLPPLERKAAVVQQRYDAQAERTLKLSGILKMQLSKGANQLAFGTKVEMEALETAKNEVRGGEMRLFVGSSSFVSEVNSKSEPISPQASNNLRGRMFVYITDPVGALLFRNTPVRNNDPDFEEFIGQLTNSYEMTCLSVPNREVRPKDMWTAKLPVILSGGKTTRNMVVSKGRRKMVVSKTPPEIIDLMLTCTYEGLRAHQGQNQALISVTGKVKARKAGKVDLPGTVTGKMHFNIDKGYVTLATLKLQSGGSIPTEDGSELAVVRTLEVSLTRVPGNTAGIVAKIPTPPPAKPALPIAKGPAILQSSLTLAANDNTNCPLKPGCSCKQVSVDLVGGKTYVIEMTKTDQSNLDPYLLLFNPKKKLVAKDDDSGGGLNARIIHRPLQTGSFTIFATTLEPGMYGTFQLTVSELAGAPVTPATPGPGPIATPRPKRGGPLSDADLNQALADLTVTQVFKRKTALERLAQTEPTKRRDEVLTKVQPLLSDRNIFVRKAAISVLGVWGTAEQEKTVLPFLQDGNVFVRKEACIALGRIGTRESLPALETARNDAFLRQEAAEAIAAINQRLAGAKK